MQATRLHIHNIRVHMHCPCAFIVIMCELASADSQYMAASTYIVFTLQNIGNHMLVCDACVCGH